MINQPWAVLVTGSREWENQDAIDAMLRRYDSLKAWTLPVLIHGAAEGADTIGDDLANGLGWTVLDMPAQWNRDGNAAMLRVLLALGECGYQTVVEAFPGPKSKGTWDMVKRAERAGVTVHVTKST